MHRSREFLMNRVSSDYMHLKEYSSRCSAQKESEQRWKLLFRFMIWNFLK
jgi:hypothetical protein